ncbi:MAG: imidazole glycerol phosphate synthase subunit HisH [Actinomycetota bacterium]
MIAILDYGSGNLRSAQRAFALTGHETVVTSDPEICRKSDGLVVPGVGAYSACMKQLIAAGGESIISTRVAEGKPMIGICVGEQILFESGTEKGKHAGLGIFNGEVSQIDAPILPHIGWNNVSANPSSILFDGLVNESFYFVHSFAAKKAVDGALNSWCEYGENFLAAVERGPISAVQFHPEKSGAVGARLISNWARTL